MNKRFYLFKKAIRKNSILSLKRRPNKISYFDLIGMNLEDGEFIRFGEITKEINRTNHSNKCEMKLLLEELNSLELEYEDNRFNEATEEKMECMTKINDIKNKLIELINDYVYSC